MSAPSHPYPITDRIERVARALTRAAGLNPDERVIVGSGLTADSIEWGPAWMLNVHFARVAIEALSTEPGTTANYDAFALPCDVRIGTIVFREGVRLGTLVRAAERWFAVAAAHGSKARESSSRRSEESEVERLSRSIDWQGHDPFCNFIDSEGHEECNCSKAKEEK